jgi:hypothetical protein
MKQQCFYLPIQKLIPTSAVEVVEAKAEITARVQARDDFVPKERRSSKICLS